MDTGSSFTHPSAPMIRKNRKRSLQSEDIPCLIKIPKPEPEYSNIVDTSHLRFKFSKNQFENLSNILGKLQKPAIQAIAEKYNISKNSRTLKCDLVNQIILNLEAPLLSGNHRGIVDSMRLLEEYLINMTSSNISKKSNLILPKITDIEVEPIYDEKSMKYDSQSVEFIQTRFATLLQQSLPDWRCISPVSQLYVEPPLLSHTQFTKLAFKLSISFPSFLDPIFYKHDAFTASQPQRLVLVSTTLPQCSDISYPPNIRSPLYLTPIQGDLQKEPTFYYTLTNPRERPEFTVQYTRRSDHRYALQLFLVTVRDVQDHVDQISSRNFLASSFTINMINSSLSQKDELSTIQLFLSLLCPLSRTKIKIPSKGKSCKHIGCFDLYSFLSVLYNRDLSSRHQIGCPICGNPIKPCKEELVVDEFVHQIISQIPDTASGVTLERGGKWNIRSDESYKDAKRIAIDLTSINDDDPDIFDWSAIKIKKEITNKRVVTPLRIIPLDSSSDTSEYDENEYYYDDTLYPGFLEALGIVSQFEAYADRSMNQRGGSGSSVNDAIVID